MRAWRGTVTRVRGHAARLHHLLDLLLVLEPLGLLRLLDLGELLPHLCNRKEGVRWVRVQTEGVSGWA